jgi:hypothetical protein
MRILLPLCAVLVACVLMTMGGALVAQSPVSRTPSATLVPATTVSFNGLADSNSPAVWEVVNGRRLLFLFTSFNGWSTRQFGTQLTTLTSVGPVAFDAPPPHGVWLEAIVPDADGTWYGYYHNERPADVCGDTSRMLPRIGAARSRDFGATWEDLGIVLEAPPDSHDCATTNRYFVGGVGDFSAILDHNARYLYFFFSQYANREGTQGVAVARMPWAFRDQPRGRVAVWWRGMAWAPPRRIRQEMDGEERLPAEYAYWAGMPIYRAADDWHAGQTVDAFWGPSVHWNTYLEQYVMLLNRAIDSNWRQEGIYVAFAPTLDDPTAWSAPMRLLSGGDWYPQVIGLESEGGTDKIAGQRARLFLEGRSRYFIEFVKNAN